MFPTGDETDLYSNTLLSWNFQQYQQFTQLRISQLRNQSQMHIYQLSHFNNVFIVIYRARPLCLGFLCMDSMGTPLTKLTQCSSLLILWWRRNKHSFLIDGQKLLCIVYLAQGILKSMKTATKCVPNLLNGASVFICMLWGFTRNLCFYRWFMLPLTGAMPWPWTPRFSGMLFSISDHHFFTCT